MIEIKIRNCVNGWILEEKEYLTVNEHIFTDFLDMMNFIRQKMRESDYTLVAKPVERDLAG